MRPGGWVSLTILFLRPCLGWALLAILLLLLVLVLVLLLVLQDKERVSPGRPELETVHTDTVIQVSDSLVKGT